MTAPKTDLEQSVRPEDRLIVALDVDSAEKARSIVSELDGLVNTFKVGLQLFAAEGAGLVSEMVDEGKRVFLDLKFHDIPNTVAKAGIEAAKLGVWTFNIHAAGGGEMMKRTALEVAEFCEASNRPRPLVIGVTVLTSSDRATLEEIGIDSDPHQQVARLASLAEASGLDGVVASANEIAVIRSTVSNPGFVVVTPGIRPNNATNDDQKRVMTPGSAVSAGADHIVVGRPILEAADRRTAAENILDEIKGAQ